MGQGNRPEGGGNKSTFEGAAGGGKGAEIAMDNGSGTAHGDPRPVRHHTESRIHRKFRFFYEAVVPIDYCTSQVFVVWPLLPVLCLIYRERPPTILRNVEALYLPKQSGIRDL